MAETEDTLVIFIVLVIIGLLICRGLFALASHIDQQSYEKRRFYLSVAADLDRMDKIIRENKKLVSKEPELILPTKNWVGRN
jgi:hypothetical protein